MFKFFIKNPPTGRDVNIVPEISYDYMNKKCVLKEKGGHIFVHLPFDLVKTMYKSIIKAEEMNITQ